MYGNASLHILHHHPDFNIVRPVARLVDLLPLETFQT
jgi:hypothetical protein